MANNAETLNGLNKAFYATNAPSFGETRANPWPGWERVLAEAVAAGVVPARETAALQVGEDAETVASAAAAPARKPVCVADIGAGNGRFERYLLDRFADVSWDFTMLDICPVEAFGESAISDARAITCDITAALAAGGLPLPDAAFDLVTCFGLAHHLPTPAQRPALMRELVRVCAPGGLVAVSFWRFMDDERLAEKARATTAEALAYFAAQGTPVELGESDYLLGWQDRELMAGNIRFAHHFAESEIEVLSSEAIDNGARLAVRFRADGRGEGLNDYVVLRV